MDLLLHFKVNEGDENNINIQENISCMEMSKSSAKNAW